MGISVFDEEKIRGAIFEEKNIKKQKKACKKIYRKQMKYARQRAERGFSDEDLWDINEWFLTLIPKMLKKYKKKRHGSPGCLGENYTNDEEFTEKYGLFGEKLQTEEERKKNKKSGCQTAHFMSELPEYQEIDKKYSDYEKKLEDYREQCYRKAMKLFTKWLPYLWD